MEDKNVKEEQIEKVDGGSTFPQPRPRKRCPNCGSAKISSQLKEIADQNKPVFRNLCEDCGYIWDSIPGPINPFNH
ncbi:MAG: hypothetical protein IKD66_07290 [Solobacterium sp.]|nr:hypothetical protein [Solobacterium sp.]